MKSLWSIVCFVSLLHASTAARIKPSATVKRQIAANRLNRARSSAIKVDAAHDTAAESRKAAAAQRPNVSNQSSEAKAFAWTFPFLTLSSLPQANASQFAVSSLASLASIVEGSLKQGAEAVSRIPFHQRKTKTMLVMGMAVFILFTGWCSWYCIKNIFDESTHKQKPLSQAPGSTQSTSSMGSKRGRSFNPEERVQYLDQEGQVLFEWTQDASTITMFIDTPQGTVKEGLEVVIQSKTVQIGLVGKRPFLLQETYDMIDQSSSRWRLRSSGELQVCLQKARRAEWPTPLIRREPGRAFPPPGG